MNFLKDEAGQGAAEYILLFGGVIVIAIAALSNIQILLHKCFWSRRWNRCKSSQRNMN